MMNAGPQDKLRTRGRSGLHRHLQRLRTIALDWQENIFMNGQSKRLPSLTVILGREFYRVILT